MPIKLRLFLKKLIKKFSKGWYRMMKPVATALNKLEENKRKKFNKKVTEEEFIKWAARDIVKYLVRYNGKKIEIIVADYISRDDFSGTHCLAYDDYRLIRSKKAIRAYYLFKRTTDLQMRVMEELKNTKGICVEEYVEEFKPWYHIKGYVKTFKVYIK